MDKLLVLAVGLVAVGLVAGFSHTLRQSPGHLIAFVCGVLSIVILLYLLL